MPPALSPAELEKGGGSEHTSNCEMIEGIATPSRDAGHSECNEKVKSIVRLGDTCEAKSRSDVEGLKKTASVKPNTTPSKPVKRIQPTQISVIPAAFSLPPLAPLINHPVATRALREARAARLKRISDLHKLMSAHHMELAQLYADDAEQLE